MNQDKELFTSWQRKKLDEIEEVTALENAQNEGREEGLTQGREEGRAEEKNHIVRKLYDMKMPIDYISKVTDLSEDEVMYCVASPTVEYTKSSSKND